MVLMEGGREGGVESLRVSSEESLIHTATFNTVAAASLDQPTSSTDGIRAQSGCRPVELRAWDIVPGNAR